MLQAVYPILKLDHVNAGYGSDIWVYSVLHHVKPAAVQLWWKCWLQVIHIPSYPGKLIFIPFQFVVKKLQIERSSVRPDSISVSNNIQGVIDPNTVVG
jgi:hypothetical protein